MARMLIGEFDGKALFGPECRGVSGVVCGAALGAGSDMGLGAKDAAWVYRARTVVGCACGCGASGISSVAVCEGGGRERISGSENSDEGYYANHSLEAL